MARTIGIALAVATLSHCAKSDNSAATDTAKSGDAAAGTAAASAPPPPPPTALSTSYDRITDDNLGTEIHKLDFGKGQGHAKPRPCTGGNSACSTTVTIDPEATALGIMNRPADGKTISLLNKGTYVIARLINKGTTDESLIPLPAGDTAYWLVEPDQNQNSVSRFVQVKKSGGQWHKNELLNVGIRHGFVGCNHPSNDVLAADFFTCDKVYTNSRDVTPATARGRDDAPDASPPWISCAAGCCIATTEAGGQACPGGKDCPPKPPCKEKGCPGDGTAGLKSANHAKGKSSD